MVMLHVPVTGTVLHVSTIFGLIFVLYCILFGIWVTFEGEMGKCMANGHQGQLERR
jgi:hypothetical protein